MAGSNSSRNGSREEEEEEAELLPSTPDIP